MKTTFLTVITAFVLIGCSKTTIPSGEKYSLYTGGIGTPYKTSIASSKTLQYARIKAPASLSSKSILYTQNENETGSYLYSSWLDSPSSMIENSTLKALQESRLFNNIVPASSKSDSDYILESDLNALYHRIHDTRSSDGMIDITYRLIDAHTRQCIASKRLSIARPSDSQDAKGGVKALKNSMNEINREIIQWLDETIQRKKL